MPTAERSPLAQRYECFHDAPQALYDPTDAGYPNIEHKFDFITRDGHVVHECKDGKLRKLVNSIVLLPEDFQSTGYANFPLVDSYRKELEERYGKDFRERLKGKRACVFVNLDGWGHSVEGIGGATALACLGVETMVVAFQELATNQEDYWSSMKKLWYSRKSLGENPNVDDQVRELSETSLQNWFHDAVAASLLKLMGKAAVELDKKTQGHDVKKDGNRPLLLRMIDDHQTVERILASVFVDLDARLADQPYQKSMEHFLDRFNVDTVIHTHVTSARALAGTKYEKRGIFAPPDHGYDTKETAMPMVLRAPHTTIGVAGDPVAKIMHDYFGVDGSTMFSVGTMADRLRMDIGLEKWNESERRIILSTAGNPTGLDEIKLGIEQFAEELKKIDDKSGKSLTPYRLYVFLGDHDLQAGNSTKIKDIIETIHRLGLEDNPNFQLVQTQGLLETAFVKSVLTAYCHVEIAKPGENPFVDPQWATLHVGLKAGSIHEQRNLKKLVRHWKGGTPSPWPESSFNYWTNSGKLGYLPDTDIPGFDRLHLHLVEYMNYLFGDSPDQKETIAKEMALRGYVQAPQHASFFVAAMAIDDMLNEDRMHGGSKSARQAQEDFRNWIKDFEKREKKLLLLKKS